MENIAEALEKRVDESAAWLRELDEGDVRKTPRAGAWSIAEIIGHLVDSAANNHQRFLRAQGAPSYTGPKYAQNQWVERSGYADAPWTELVDLWRLYNRHLARVIRRLPTADLDVMCTVGDDEPVTLRFLVEDYLDHLNHHLAQAERQR